MATNKFVDADHLSYFKTKLDGTYQGLESGKGLSTNDYTTAEKQKLAGIESGAEVNQNAFGQVLADNTLLTANVKTAVLTIVPSGSVTVSADASTNKITIGTTAQVNVIESVKVNNTALTITNKAVNIDLSSYATKTGSEALTNKTYNGYTLGAACAKAVATTVASGNTNLITSGAVYSALQDYALKTDISSVYRYKGSVASYSLLPTSGQVAGDIWNVETADAIHNIKAGDNVAWNGSAWDNLSGILDLSSYVKQSDITIITNDEIDVMFS